MRSLALIIGLLCSLGGVAACGGGATAGFCSHADTNCVIRFAQDTVRAQPDFQTPDAPIAVGASVTVRFEEQHCVSSSRGGTSLGTVCDPWYVPNSLFAVVALMGPPPGVTCPVSVAQTAAGTLRFTRTAPGDPKFSAGHANAFGYCLISVTDVTTNSNPYHVVL